MPHSPLRNESSKPLNLGNKFVKQQIPALAKAAEPKLPKQIDDWSGVADTDLELVDYAVHGVDFSQVKRLDAEGCKFSGVQLAGAVLDKLQLSDALAINIEAAGLRAPEAAFLRLTAQHSRFTGADMGAAQLEDCTFEDTKFDEAGLRFAKLKRVRFKNCVLRNLDFSNAKLSHVSFSDCDLDGVNFSGTTCAAVDLRGETLTNIKGVMSLKNVIVTSDQLVQLAPMLAAEVGLNVEYDS